MKCSVELSLYPLGDDFKKEVKAFIRRLEAYEDIKVEAGSISTRVFGEYRRVMAVLTDEMERSFEYPASVFVLKVLNLDRDK